MIEGLLINPGDLVFTGTVTIGDDTTTQKDLTFIVAANVSDQLRNLRGELHHRPRPGKAPPVVTLCPECSDDEICRR